MGCQSTGSRREKGGVGRSMVGGCRKPPKLYSIGILTADPLPNFPWHWVCPMGFQHKPCLCCMTKTSVPAKQQCSKQKSFSPADLHQYMIWCLLRGKHSKRNMTKEKHWQKPRRRQGWRNPTLCKSMHLKWKSCSSDCPLANCPSGEKKVSLWFTKIHQNYLIFKSIFKAFKQFLLTWKLFHDN